MRVLAFLLTLFFLSPQPSNAGTIILLVDVSSSIKDEEQEMQFSAYSQALLEIGTLVHSDIEVVLFESIPFHIASGSNVEASEAFKHITLRREVAALDGPGSNVTRQTCLTRALSFIEEEILPKVQPPVILDISTDGRPNCKEDWTLGYKPILDRMGAQGVRVNVLFITGQRFAQTAPDTIAEIQTLLMDLPRNNGFIIEANGFDSFLESLYKKLVLEIAMLEEDYGRY